jgi:hypothetical protein
MNWINQDWEHEAIKDEIYLMEYRKELEWEQWEKTHSKKPAIIKLINPLKLKKNASRNKFKSIRRTYKKRIQH